MNKIKALIPLLATILIIGCAQVRITGSGNLVTQEEAVTGFDEVDVSQSFNVDITQGDTFQVVIRVDDNLVEHLNITKQGSTLRINLKPSRNYILNNATLEAEVTMPELVGVDASGSSDVNISGFDSTKSLVVDLSGASTLSGDIQAGDASFDISGSSEVRLTGSAEDIEVGASGSSEADLSDFQASNANVDASGASEVVVNLSGRLNADASGSSDIYYLGNPTLGNIDTSGSSSVQSR